MEAVFHVFLTKARVTVTQSTGFIATNVNGVTTFFTPAVTQTTKVQFCKSCSEWRGIRFDEREPEEYTGD